MKYTGTDVTSYVYGADLSSGLVFTDVFLTGFQHSYNVYLFIQILFCQV